MAVTAAVAPLPKGEPDISKLNTFTGRTVQVTKYLAPRGGIGSTILAPTEMALTGILQLMTSLPMTHGPGFYKFTVSDTGGTGDDTWMTKLGPESPQEAPVALNGFPNNMGAASAGANVPLSENVRHLGHGFYYDNTLGLLTTPWREIVPWSEGQPLPKAPTATTTPSATPWLPPGAPGGWGGYPVESSDSAEVKRLQAQIAEDRRRTEMDAMRADVRRGQDETAKTIAALVDKLTSVLTAKPSGPTDTERETQRRLDESERRAEAAERRAEEERRETKRQDEMRAMNERFERGLREATSSKTDPMMPMILQLMTAAAASSSDSVKAIQAASAATAAASERGVAQLVASMAGNNIGPLQLVSLLQTAKSDSADAARTIMETARGAIELQKDTFMQLLDAAGSGSQPPWVGVVQTGLEKVSALGVALAERNAIQQQQAPQQQQQMQRLQQRAPQQRMAAPPQAPVMGPMQGAAPQQTVTRAEPLADRPGAIATGERPAGTEYDAATDMFIVPDGREFAQSDVAKNGWAVVLSRTVRQTQAAAPASPAAPAAQPALALVPDEVIAPAPTPAAKKRRGKKEAEMPQPAGQAAENVPAHYTLDQLRDMDPAVLHAMFADLPDAELFGALLLPYVAQLRNPLLPAEQVAKHVLQARGQVQGFGGPVPMALELLDVGQLDVLVSRLFPEASVEYQDLVVTAIGNALEAEDAGDEEPDAPAS